MKIPTSADVSARRIATLKETLRKSIQDGDLDLYVQLVEQLAEEGPYDVAEVAAAAARLASAARPLAVQQVVEAPPPRREAPARRAVPAEGKVRLSIGVGKRDGIRPADVVGSIANEAGIPGSDIGPIDIRDDVTYVTLPEDVVEHVIKSVGRAKFRGRPLNLRVAGPDEGGEPAFRKFDRRPPSFVPGKRPFRTGSGPRGDSAPRRDSGPRRDSAPRGDKREGGFRKRTFDDRRPSFGAGKRTGGPKPGGRGR